MHAYVLSVLVAAAILGVPATSSAAPGDFDTTFSGDGALAIDFGFGGGDYVEDVARQPDGKLVVAGGSDDNLAIARLLHDGSLDASFADAGRLTASGGPAIAVAIQSDGKILALLDDGAGATVRRYTPAGLPDESFAGDGGQAIAAVTSGSDLAVQEDGMIVVSGWADVGDEGTGFAIARLESDGSLDDSFSGDGVHVHDFAGASAYTSRVAIQSDGKIVAAGSVSTGDGETTFGGDFALARYNANGSLDTSFSDDGMQTTNFETGYQYAEGLAIHSDGTIVAAGYVSSTATHGIAVARYDAGGSLDAAFSGDGRQILELDFDFAPPDASDVAVQGDGKVVIAGTVSKDSFFDSSDFLVLRLTQAGSLDPGFAGDGVQTTNFGGNDRAADVLVEPDGAIVAAGVAHPSDFGLARYGVGGAAEPSLSGDGRATVDFPGVEHASDVLVQPDGKVVTIGSSGSYWGTGAVALTRHAPDGSLDAGFGQDGIQITPFDDYGSGVAGALQSDGKVLAVGGRDIGNEDAWIVARYNPDGSLDPTFSGDGKQTVGFDGFASFPTASDVAVLPDGRILIVGTAEDPDDEPTGVGIARLHPDGSLDTSFSGDGRRTIGVADSYHRPRVALAPGGKFVVATVGYEEGESSFVEGLQVSRFDSSGSFDETFSDDGRHTVDFNHFESVIGVAVQPADGRIVAAVGTFQLDGPNPIGLVRLDANGSLDTSFGDAGRQTLDFGYNYENGGDLLLRPDGRIVLSVAQGLAQLTPDGELDTTFSGDGLVSPPLGTIHRVGRAAIDANGSIVVAGSLDQDLALVRYVGHPLPAADTTAPVTTITSGPEGATTVSTPTFTFSSNEPGSTFECRVGGGAFAACSSPHTTAPLAAGGHTFEVRATDLAGNVDPSPAARSFTVQPPGSPAPTDPSGDNANPVPPPPPAAGGTPAPVVQPGSASTPAEQAACRRARSARKRATERLKAVGKKIRAAGSPATKGKLRRVAAKRKVALRKATRRAKRAC